MSIHDQSSGRIASACGYAWRLLFHFPCFERQVCLFFLVTVDETYSLHHGYILPLLASECLQRLRSHCSNIILEEFYLKLTTDCINDYNLPSSYIGLKNLLYGFDIAPHSGNCKLLQVPSYVRILDSGSHFNGREGHVSSSPFPCTPYLDLLKLEKSWIIIDLNP